MLTVEGLSAAYGSVTVLRNVSMSVIEGQIVTIIGANGAGKSTLMRTIIGLHKPSAGRVTFQEQDITGVRAYKVVKKGLSLIPEGRQLFGGLTVLDNFRLGSLGYGGKWSKGKWSKGGVDQRIAELMDIFPRLRERANQLAGTLSGGEQQMLAIARGLMANPKFLMLDEPSLGLAPLIVDEIFALLCKLNLTGVSIFLVEQNAYAALGISHRAYVLENGRVVREGKASELLDDEDIHLHYLGGKAL